MVEATVEGWRSDTRGLPLQSGASLASGHGQWDMLHPVRLAFYFVFLQTVAPAVARTLLLPRRNSRRPPRYRLAI